MSYFCRVNGRKSARTVQKSHFNSVYHYKQIINFCQRFLALFKKIMRIDKFLKISRILKRRTLSKEACEKGKVLINGREAKPAHQIRIGDECELQFAGGSVKFRILNIKETVKKDEASSLYEII